MPEAMPGPLLDYVRRSYREREKTRKSFRKNDASLSRILSLVRARAGRDFSGYKVSSLTRRIGRRMAVNQLETAEDYIRFLEERPSEIDDIVRDFLINVTSFFRDPEAFEALKKQIGEALADKPEGVPFRAWIPGCSTGEEAYSIAMVILECVQESGRHRDIQVFATDLDAEAVATARAGVYSSAVAQDVDQQRLKRFFDQKESSYRVDRDVREKVVFAVHDLVMDPPYSRMDIVSVRNLLIYFDTASALLLERRGPPVLGNRRNRRRGSRPFRAHRQDMENLPVCQQEEVPSCVLWRAAAGDRGGLAHAAGDSRSPPSWAGRERCSRAAPTPGSTTFRSRRP